MDAGPFIAAGNILPCRFVKLLGSDAFLGGATSTEGFEVVQATGGLLLDGEPFTGDRTLGIVADTTRHALPGIADGQYTAMAGEALPKIYIAGDICSLELGAAVLAGDLLKSDADGRGIPVTMSQYVEHFDPHGVSVQVMPQWVGAEALEPGQTGEKIRVIVRNYPYRTFTPPPC